MADQVHSTSEALFAAIHEATHRGLRKTFGADLNPILRQIYATNKSARDAADQMMAAEKMSKEEAVEEVLADMAYEGKALSDKWNTYLQEELFHGRAAKRTKDFVTTELKPLLAGMKLWGLTVVEYLAIYTKLLKCFLKKQANWTQRGSQKTIPLITILERCI